MSEAESEVIYLSSVNCGEVIYKSKKFKVSKRYIIADLNGNILQSDFPFSPLPKASRARSASGNEQLQNVY